MREMAKTVQKKAWNISPHSLCKDTHIYKSNVLRCFSECHPHHVSYGMVSDKLYFDFCLELFNTYSGKDYFFTEGWNGSVWHLTTSEKDIAILTIVIAEERQLLGSISVWVAVIEVEYYLGGNFLVWAYELVVAECVAVIRILIPGRNLEHTLGQHFLQAVYYEVFIPPFQDVRCQAREKTLA